MERDYNQGMVVTPSISRRRVQFGLSTLFLLTTLVAVTVAWFTGQVATVRQRQALERFILERGGSVYTSLDLADQRPISPIRRWLGDEPVSRIYLPPPDFSEQDFARVKAAFPDADIWPSEPVVIPSR